MLRVKYSLNEKVKCNKEHNGSDYCNNEFVFFSLFHIQVIRDCLVARRIVLMCGGEQCQAFAFCKEDLSFFACRLLVWCNASLLSLREAWEAWRCVWACIDLSNAAVGFERIVSRHKGAGVMRRREDWEKRRLTEETLCPDTMRPLVAI